MTEYGEGMSYSAYVGADMGGSPAPPERDVPIPWSDLKPWRDPSKDNERHDGPMNHYGEALGTAPRIVEMVKRWRDDQSSFFGTRNPLPVAQKPSISGFFDPFKRAREHAKKTEDGKPPGTKELRKNATPKPWKTLPTWTVTGMNRDRSYTELFDSMASNSVASPQLSPKPLHRHQLPLHLQSDRYPFYPIPPYTSHPGPPPPMQYSWGAAASSSYGQPGRRSASPGPPPMTQSSPYPSYMPALHQGGRGRDRAPRSPFMHPSTREMPSMSGGYGPSNAPVAGGGNSMAGKVEQNKFLLIGDVRFSHEAVKNYGRLASDTTTGANETSGFTLTPHRFRPPFAPRYRNFDWSGRGRHITCTLDERPPLLHVTFLGNSAVAVVDKVACGKEVFARKVVQCNRRMMPLKTAWNEVKVLERLIHPHVIELVGTYCQGQRLGILLHPAATCDLETYLDSDYVDLCQSVADRSRGLQAADVRKRKLYSWILCLSTALTYLHNTKIRHKDIKPKNILVSGGRILFADFGISRDFSDQTQSMTAGPSLRTYTYCSPEVHSQDFRGRSSDVFSLGCVFVEMYTVILGRRVEDFSSYRSTDQDRSYHQNLEKVFSWIRILGSSKPEDGQFNGLEFVRRDEESGTHYSHLSNLSIIELMLQDDPTRRPLATQLQSQFKVMAGMGCHLCRRFR
ncbi:MAG: hypothetical protein M1839_009466 [Geoglossum umbratile]|nr:MAG: hypothetical protein M1839_009466 [Geoglossum umbratile]